MTIGSLQLVRTWGSDVQHVNLSPPKVSFSHNCAQEWQLKQQRRVRMPGPGLLGSPGDLWIGKSFLQDVWCRREWDQLSTAPRAISIPAKALSPRANVASAVTKVAALLIKFATLTYTRGVSAVQNSPLLLQCVPAVGLMAFAIWGLGPTMRFLRRVVKKKENSKWSTSRTQHFTASYIRPVLLWLAVIWICRAFDPVVLPTEASHAVKERFVNFIRSLSTVLAFAYCTASLTQQVQKMMMDRQENQDSRSLGVSFIGNTVYTSVWVAAVCLFMELLGFSTQKWITAGGFGTVLLTLAGREIFTNFLSSIIIHLTRPFVENEWIQTKIEGQEVSGTVEHVGWWSPTVIRGDDREAVHIPNHKFTVSVVRNLSQKTHWRIKTHIGISHLDAGKIPNIVADMRKVLSKHPQVEQQRLHRRAFFDTVDPVNQALMILVSCFVKTSHFEEYLRVKEIILLDILKVISHHNARLATPIRSVQRVLDEGETRQSPFRTSDESRRRPVMLIEASNLRAEDSDDEDLKHSGIAAEVAKEVGSKAATGKAAEVTEETTDTKVSSPKPKEKATAASEPNKKMGNASSAGETLPPITKSLLEGLDSMGLNSNDITLLKAAFEKPPVNIPEPSADTEPSANEASSRSGVPSNPAARPYDQQKASPPVGDNLSISGVLEVSEETGQVTGTSKTVPEEHDDPWRESPQIPSPSTISASQQKVDSGHTSISVQQKSEGGLSVNRVTEEKTQASPAPVPRLSSVEDNLVLGVALDGPKRTLPLDDDMPSPAKQRELVGSRNGNGATTPGKDRREQSTTQPTPPQSTTLDVRDRER
ncbi:hypothetical protein R1sor_010166 [Riccia sorocarpa]|uniref:Uncharacterized protein n=1 Tax=Riccia sorocarpa TaxID=122646 RepID=A0ABD3HX79_9MARC